MTNLEGKTDTELERMGEKIVKMFGLKPTLETRKYPLHEQMFDTAVGTKTTRGLARTVNRIFEEPTFSI